VLAFCFIIPFIVCFKSIGLSFTHYLLVSGVQFCVYTDVFGACTGSAAKQMSSSVYTDVFGACTGSAAKQMSSRETLAAV